MARILTAGNELGEYGADGFTIYRGSVTDSRNQFTGHTQPDRVRGHWSFYLTNDTGLEYDFTPIRPSGVSEFYLRLHMYFSGVTNGNWERLRFSTAAGDTLLRFGTQDGGNGGTSGGNFTCGFYDAAGSTSPFLTGGNGKNHVWHLFEMYIKFSGSDGRIRLWFDGSEVINWTGALTGTGAETEMYLFRPHYDNISGGTASSTYYDNIAINDTTGTINNSRIGNGVILPMWPTGNGSSSQLTNAFGTTTDNFKFINKRTAWNPSGFVGTNNANDKDLYAVAAMPNTYNGVNAIRLASFGVRNGPAITKAKFIVKPNGQAEIDSPAGVGVGVDLPIGSPDYFAQDFETNANTGEPFQTGEVDGMEIGTQFIA